MKTEDQRIAIAEACGWLDIQRCGRMSLKPHPEGAEFRGTLDAPSLNYARTYSRLPDYLSDLNAMHEAEKTLTADQEFDYNDTLDGIDPEEFVWKRTATQRAEAFLRTLGLWKEAA
jgi:hypothetical protein